MGDRCDRGDMGDGVTGATGLTRQTGLTGLTLLREDPWNDKCCSNGFLPRGGGGLKTLSKWFGAVI